MLHSSQSFTGLLYSCQHWDWCICWILAPDPLKYIFIESMYRTHIDRIYLCYLLHPRYFERAFLWSSMSMLMTRDKYDSFVAFRIRTPRSNIHCAPIWGSPIVYWASLRLNECIFSLLSTPSLYTEFLIIPFPKLQTPEARVFAGKQVVSWMILASTWHPHLRSFTIGIELYLQEQ